MQVNKIIEKNTLLHEINLPAAARESTATTSVKTPMMPPRYQVSWKAASFVLPFIQRQVAQASSLLPSASAYDVSVAS